VLVSTYAAVGISDFVDSVGLSDEGRTALKLTGLNFAVIAMLLAVGCAAEAEQREYVTRPNINGRPTVIPRARTFEECVQGGMKLGYPRIGPRGESDRRGAVGYCRSLPRWRS
jgi:hypothetical protein